MPNDVMFTQLGRHSSGVCSLLQFGGFNILLDCGSTTAGNSDIAMIQDKISQLGGIDFVLLTHSDMQHVGALPLLLGCDSVVDIPVICTMPLLKMAQMTLYDAQINKNMVETVTDQRGFSLDDVDHCFRNVVTVKYSQVHCREHSDGQAGEVYLYALPAGRTLGSASWVIRFGSTEVVYMVDMNLRKEYLLDGASLHLPDSPALLIIGGAVNEKVEAGSSRRKRDRGSDELISSILDTARGEGHVLVPVDSAGRTLELLLILNKYWIDNNLGMYHLAYLSPMACSTIEFVRCQLEWMSEALCHDFYMGKPNPFALSSVKIITSLKELDMLGSGPKVVLTTDASLSCGYSKQLLMRWGGDPKCRVLFTDISEAGSLAAELRSQNPPVIATVVRSERVALSGAELELFEKERASTLRIIEAASQRRRRERELTDLATFGTVSGPSFEAAYLTTVQDDWVAEEEVTYGLDGDEAVKRQKLIHESDDREPLSDGTKDGNEEPSLAMKGRITRFAQPRFRMFETRDTYVPFTDYGKNLDGIDFHDVASYSRYPARDANHSSFSLTSATGARGGAPGREPARDNDFGVAAEEEHAEAKEYIPTKLVGKRSLIQFTCGFKEVALAGRCDLRGIKTIVGQSTPQCVVLLGGSGNHSQDELASFSADLKKTGTSTWTAAVRETIAFTVMSEKIKVLLPQKIVGKSVKVCHQLEGSVNCSVNLLPSSSKFIEIRSRSTDGIRTARIIGEVSDESSREVSGIGAISVGEVPIENIRKRLELAGVVVEYRLGNKGGMLVCDGNVVIRKDDENNFSIEGVPCRALIAAQKTLYECFTFL